MKKERRNLIAVIAALTVLGLAATLTCIFRTEKTTVTKIGFYKMDDDYSRIIKDILLESAKQTENSKFKFVQLDDTKELSKQTGKADILFTPMGLAADKAILSIPEKKISSYMFDSSMLKETSRSIEEMARSSVRSTEKKVSQIPILFDGYEILLSIQSLSRAKTEMITSWTELESFINSASGFSLAGINFAAGDSDTLLGVISTLTETFEGQETYRKLIDEIKLSAEPADVLVERLAQKGQPLNEALNRIIRWKKRSALNLELIEKTNAELTDIIERYRTGATILTLSQHRKISSKVLPYFTTIPIHTNEGVFYFPAMRPAYARSLIAPAVAMISFTPNKKSKKAVQAILSRESQEILARRTGLAPFHANCPVSDMQSDDIRFWIAATSAPLVPLGNAAFDSDSRKKEFADAIRKWIVEK